MSSDSVSFSRSTAADRAVSACRDSPLFVVELRAKDPSLHFRNKAKQRAFEPQDTPRTLPVHKLITAVAIHSCTCTGVSVLTSPG